LLFVFWVSRVVVGTLYAHLYKTGFELISIEFKTISAITFQMPDFSRTTIPVPAKVAIRLAKKI
jgi:hypothetical protein